MDTIRTITQAPATYRKAYIFQGLLVDCVCIIKQFSVMSDYRLRESTGHFLGYLEMNLEMCNGCLCYIELLERPKTSKLHVRYISLFTSKLCKVIWLLWRFQSGQVTQAGDTCSVWPAQ